MTSALTSSATTPAAPATAASESLRAREERAFFERVCLESHEDFMGSPSETDSRALSITIRNCQQILYQKSKERVWGGHLSHKRAETPKNCESLSQKLRIAFPKTANAFPGNPTEAPRPVQHLGNHFMPTATTTSHDTGQQVSPRGLHREAQQPVTQQERSAAHRLRNTMAVRLVEDIGIRRLVSRVWVGPQLS